MQLFDFTVNFPYRARMSDDGKNASVRRWLTNTLHFANGLLSGAERPQFVAGKPVVVLLAGLGVTAGTMSMLASRLEQDGYLPATFELGFMNLAPVQVQANRLLDRLRTLPPAVKGRVALIGHSLGGIVGRYAVALCGGNRYVHTLITLGSPHRGAPLAGGAGLAPLRWASHGFRDLDPGSDCMRELAEAPIPPDVSLASLFSEADALCPRPCAEIELQADADNVANVNVGRYGHFEFVVDEDIYAAILRELSKGIAGQKA